MDFSANNNENLQNYRRGKILLVDLTSNFDKIKNIFDKQLALLAQTLIAITPFFHVEAIITHSEILPVFLIFLSLYFLYSSIPFYKLRFNW